MRKQISIRSIEDFVAKKYFLLFLLGIGIILRFLFLRGQIWLGSDITRDIAISLEGLRRNDIPLTGSFSSAGPFVFGPAIYWVYMISFILFPFSLLTPWYGAFVVSIFALVIFYLFARFQRNYALLLMVTLITVLSPQMILSAGTPTQHIYVLVFTLLSIFLLHLFWRAKNLLYALLAGLCIGLSINMHYQAVNLFFLPLIVLFFEKQNVFKKLIGVLLIYVGIFVALLPLTIWDSGQSFANYRNLLDYLLIGQSRVYVPNSWRLYLFGYLPNYWSFVTGLPSVFGIGVFFSGIVLSVYELFWRRRLSFLVLLNFVFLFMVFVGRYYKGERFPGYTIYLLPFMILFTAWAITKISKIITFKVGGIGANHIFLAIVILSIFINSFSILSTHVGQNSSLNDVGIVTDKISHAYPGQKFKVFNLSGTNPDASFAMAAFLRNQKLYALDSNLGLAFCMGCKEANEAMGELFGNSYFVLDSNNLGSKWQLVSQEGIFDSNTGWLNQHNLKSSFNLDKYIKDKIFR